MEKKENVMEDILSLMERMNFSEDELNNTNLKFQLSPIDEVTSSRIINHSKNGFVILSSNRSDVFSDNKDCDLTSDFKKYAKAHNFPDNEEEREKWLKIRNKISDKLLKKEIENSDFSYKPVYGGYHGQDSVVDSYEPSYIVFCEKKGGKLADFSELFNFAIKMCKLFKQECVYINKPDKEPGYYDCNGDKVNFSATKNTKFKRDDEEFYTTTKRKKNNVDKFTSDIKFTDDSKDDNKSTEKTFKGDFKPEELLEGMYHQKASRIEYVNRIMRSQRGEILF